MLQLTDEQKDILSDYTDDLSSVKTITYYKYTTASGKEVSKILEEYHVLWFWNDSGNMYLVPRNDKDKLL